VEGSDSRYIALCCQLQAHVKFTREILGTAAVLAESTGPC
jgi:hypothetical protein